MDLINTIICLNFEIIYLLYIMDDIVKVYRDGDDVLRKAYNKIFPNVEYTIWDGVFAPRNYALNSFRVLFMNREPYDEAKDEYNVVETIREQIGRGEDFWCTQTWLKRNIRDQLAILSLLKEKDIVRLTDGQIEKRINEFRISDSLFRNELLESAYINVKKSDGKKGSSCNDLREYAQRGMCVLKAQIAFFNPSVIVGGNIVDHLLDGLVEWGDNLYVKSEHIKVFQLKVGDSIYPFIDAYHPSAMGYGKKDDVCSMDGYYACLVAALKGVAQDYEGYWEKRRDLPVFRMENLMRNL